MSASLPPAGLMESGENRLALYWSFPIENIYCWGLKRREPLTKYMFTFTESSAHLEEEKNNVDEISNPLETIATSHHKEEAKQVGPEYGVVLAISAADNRKQKSAQELVDGNVVSNGELRTSKRKRKPKVCKTVFSMNS